MFENEFEWCVTVMGLDSLGRLPTILPERVVLIILFVVRRMTALSGSSHALAAFLVINPVQSSTDTVCTCRWSSAWLRVSGPGQTRGVVWLMSLQGCTPSFEKTLDISADSVRRKRGEGIERRGHMLEVCSHALCGICSEMCPLCLSSCSRSTSRVEQCVFYNRT